jgi:hypothetical protein
MLNLVLLFVYLPLDMCLVIVGAGQSSGSDNHKIYSTAGDLMHHLASAEQGSQWEE